MQGLPRRESLSLRSFRYANDDAADPECGHSREPHIGENARDPTRFSSSWKEGSKVRVAVLYQEVIQFVDHVWESHLRRSPTQKSFSICYWLRYIRITWFVAIFFLLFFKDFQYSIICIILQRDKMIAQVMPHSGPSIQECINSWNETPSFMHNS